MARPVSLLAYKVVEFNSDTSFLVGARFGFKFLMMAVEANYFQAGHNVSLKDLVTINWDGREVDYSYLGLNVKYFFPLLLLHPYVSVGYGYYTASIQDIGEDTQMGFNVGLGLELHVGSKFALNAEGRYHRVGLDIDNRELKIGDFTINGGLSIYF